MIAMFHLARSLAADKGPDAGAYNNSWGFDTHEDQHDYYLSLMAAMNVRWIGHTYHSSHMFGPGYPHHDCWKTMRAHLDEHRHILELLEGATPANDTAVLYNWRALATHAGNYLHVHRRNLLFLARQLTLTGRQFQFISTERLADSTATEGRLNTPIGAFTRLIVPWPDLLTPETFATLESIAGHVDVLIFGSPAKLLTNGRSVVNRFNRLVGISSAREHHDDTGAPINIAGRTFRIDPAAIEPKYRSNEKHTYTDHYKRYALTPARDAETIARAPRQPVGVRRGRTMYLAAEVPHYPGLIQSLTPSQHPAPPGELLLFRYTRGDELLLTGATRWSKPLSGSLDWQGHTLKLDRCKAFVARLENQTLRLDQFR
jgi:hypothetical protein